MKRNIKIGFPQQSKKDKQQKSMHFILINGLKNKMNGESNRDKIIKNQTKLQAVQMTSITRPAISPYQIKIREAIQIRYSKSKIKGYNYQSVDNLSFDKINQYFSSQNPNKNQIFDQKTFEIESQNSLEMEQMSKFIYMADKRFININQYHQRKIKQGQLQKQQNPRKIKRKKHKIQYIKSQQSLQLNLQLSGAQRSSIGNKQKKIKDQYQNMQEYETNKKYDTRDYKNFNLPINKQKQRSLLYSQSDQLEFSGRKSLTSREIINKKSRQKDMQIIQVKNTQGNYQISPQTLIKDTFKLKKVTHFRNLSDKDQTNFLNTNLNMPPYPQKTHRSIKSKGRRYLLKNQRKQLLNKTQITQQIPRGITNKKTSVKKDQKKLKPSSLRKIQTQLLDFHQNQQTLTPIYQQKKQNQKNEILPQYQSSSLLNHLQEASQRNIHSISEQKWKLEEINFKFKPLQNHKFDMGQNQLNNFMTIDQKPQKNGFSLQKAYEKLLSQRKLRKQEVSQTKSDSKPSNSDNIKRRFQTIQKDEQIDLRRSNLPNNRRRKLRIRTQIDQPRINQSKINKNFEQDSLSAAIGKSPSLFQKTQKQTNFPTTFRKRQKTFRFQTIF